MRATPRTSGGVQAGQLLVAAGLFTVINNVLPGYGHLDVVVLYSTGCIAVLLGLIALRVPWQRLPQRAPLVLTLPALALIAISDAAGGVSPYSYAIYFVLVFVWVGIAQPPLTSLWLLPLLIAAYIAPAAAIHSTGSELVASATVVIPVCLVVAEMLARATRKQQQASYELVLRVKAVEKLASLTADIGRDLEPFSVAQSIADCAAELFDGKAIFGSVEDGALKPIALRGLPAEELDRRVSVPQTAVAKAAKDPRRVAVSTPGQTRLPVPAGGCVVTVACFANAELSGALSVVLDRSSVEVTDEVLDLLRLIGAQSEVALSNADKHSELLDERRHEQAVFDVLVDGVIVLDAEGDVRSCNAAAATLFDWTVGSMVGHPLPIAIAPGETIESEVAPRRWIETSAVALDATGEVVLTLRDVSRQHALDEAKDLFLATTSHELRTPLTAIKGYVATLQRHWSRLDEVARKRALAVVDEQTDALIRLTDHLLLGARVASSTRTKQTFDLSLLVRACAAAYSEISPSHRIRADTSAGIPLAIGDADSVRGALAQLIENSVKFSPTGGDVQIEVRPDPAGIAIEVLDRGVGLPAGRESTLFAPFVQGDAPNTRSFGGVGLGLYIVKRLIEAQGGQVSGRQRVGGGSIFRMVVPSAPLPEQRDDRDMSLNSRLH